MDESSKEFLMQVGGMTCQGLRRRGRQDGTVPRP